jgi:DNA-binding NarL/FixJ family response regulator
MMKMKVTKEMTTVEIDTVIKSEVSKSEKMKKLFQGGMDVKAISELMGTRYNFVYNVVSNMIRVNDLENEIIKEAKDNKHSEIVRLLTEGKSNIEISKELKVNYNYVWKVVNEELRKGKEGVAK